MTEVATLLRGSAGGRGGALFVVSAAGLGKTTTLEAARQEARRLGLRTGVACGGDMETSLRFGLLAQALSELGGPDALLGGDAPTPGDVRSYRFHRTLRWLEDLGDVVLVLDDLHWADPDSLALLSFLCRRTGSLSLTIIGALRPWPAAAHEVVAALTYDGYAKQVRLEPLSRTGTADLLTTRLGAPVADATVEAAWELCGGNPLLLQQAVQVIADGGELAALPDVTSNGLLLSRFAGLPNAGIRYAEAASVLGTRFRPHVAAEMVRMCDAELDAANEGLFRSELVRADADGLAQFTHPLFAQALYDNVSPATRDRLHRKAFLVLSERGLDEEAAEHAIRAGQPGDREAIALLTKVGQAAASTGALGAATRSLHAAVELAGARVEPELLLALGNALLTNGRPDQAIVVLERLRGLEPVAVGTRVGGLRMLAHSYFVTGAHGAADAAFQQAGELASARLPGEVALKTMVDRAHAARFSGGPARALPLMSQALEAAATADPDLRLRTDMLHAWLALEAGMAEPWQRLEAALRESGTDPLSTLTSDATWSWSFVDAYASISIAVERFGEAERVLRTALTAAEQVGAVDASGALSLLFVPLYLRTGPVGTALVHAERAASLADMLVFESFAGLARVGVLLPMGRHAEAFEWYERTERAAISRDERLVLPQLLHLRALHDFDMGRIAEACERYDQIEGLTTSLGIGEPCLAMGARHAMRAYLAAERFDAITHIIARLEHSAGQLPCRWPKIALATGRAWLAEQGGDHEQAERHFRSALAHHAEVALPMEHADTLVAFGSFLRRHGRPSDARPLLAEALAIAEANQAGRLARLAQSELAVAGGRRRRRSESTGLLTAQETRVAQLAAEGHSDKEIAQRLVLSVKTVQHHLRHVYAKLGVNSRRQLMTAAGGSLSTLR